MAYKVDETVPSKLIKRYNDLIKAIGDEYIPSDNYKKNIRKSGVYFDAIDGSHYFSFHKSKTIIKNNKEFIIPNRIHLKIYVDDKEIIIDFKLNINNNILTLIPKTSSYVTYNKYVTNKIIINEISNINQFLTQFNKNKIIDKTDPPPKKLSFNKFSIKNKYFEYKFKYFILKKLFT